MNKQTKARWITLAAAAALVAASAGCHNTSTARLHGERFEDDEAPHAYRNIASVQAATGARADATLHPTHFNAAGLNSLGRQKLDLMLLDDEAAPPMVVYLDLAKDDSAKQARTAVTEYLKGRGLAESQFKIEDGPNPKTLHRVEENMAAMDALKNATSNANGSSGQQGGGYSSSNNNSSASPAPTPMSH